MSDSFSDLWASSLPKQPQQLPLKSLVASANNSSNNSASDAARRPNSDSFSILASAGSSRSNSRPITPSAKPQPLPPNNPGAGDAFGGLVSFGGTAPRDDHLTIAERAAKAERERLGNIYDSHGAALKSQHAGSFWDQFEGPSKPRSETKSSSTWDFDVLVPVPTQAPSDNRAPAPAVSNGSAEWDLDFISSAPTVSIVPPSAQPIRDIFDVEELDTLEHVRPKESESTDILDFVGHAEETLPIAREEETVEDDILGTLARPVEEVRRLSSKTPSPAPAQAPKSSASPPPHVVGRIVEMGFSLQQAKIALAATDSGVDVDAALEILVQNVGQDPEREREQQEDTSSEDMEAEPERKPPPRRKGPSSTGIVTSGSSSQRLSPSPSSQPGLQDKLLAQASTIGLNMFNRANAMWKEGRDKVVKVYEEQKAANAGTDAAKTSGRPKWMDEAARFDDFAESSADASRTGDSRPPLVATRSQPVPPPQRKFLFVEETQQVYKSPARRRPPSTSPSSPPPPSAPPSQSSKPPSRPHTPPITRPTISVSPSALATSNTHKEAGTTHFKLGRFAEAEVSYSSALAALPASHVLRVPLHNNRALARLRTGDYKGTVDDAGEVLRIVEGDAGRSWHPGREVNGAVIDGVDLGVALEKSLRRRAEANEGMERWREAGRDWERLSAAGWMGAAIKEEAIKSAVRCRRMLNGPPPESAIAASRPPTTTKRRAVPVPAVAAAATRPSEALSRVRAANAAQDAEDQSRLEFKDSIDARLSSWRTGKEANLRGLIASLDTVLWPELGWQKVGMAELVSSAQVKARYMKAIGKVHPDKLNVTNTTVEQRMIANGVFGTLNEAWNAFR